MEKNGGKIITRVLLSGLSPARELFKPALGLDIGSAWRLPSISPNFGCVPLGNPKFRTIHRNRKNYRAPIRRGQTPASPRLSSRDYPEIRSFRPERLHILEVGARKPSQFRLFAAFCLGKAIAYTIPDATRNTVATPLSWQAALPKR